MTNTATTIQSPQETINPNQPAHPADVLMNLIVNLLAPMFLGASGGDIGFARAAAIDTVNAYRIRNNADLVTIAQIIAFGLAALGSLSLSMADDISLSMTLRLRGNANALNRSAEQNRRALREASGNSTTRPDAPASIPSVELADQAALSASVAAAQQTAADIRTRLQDAQPATVSPSATTKQRNQASWATAMADAAAKLTASLANLPPAERQAASLRAETLASTANALLSGIGSAALR